ncbi:MAG: 3-phosphoshikimate 1-carboxyvinyltransferase [Candidatus Anoxychlamydiales bacterium]|nr:3-phosphoshikimate 1-carboxyvinyltransferase [Candidatus Anoxychlamydiales bacterium]
MKNYFIKKSILKGSIVIPPSKSQTVRAIIFASFAKKESLIKNFLKSKDTFALIDIMKNIGAKIDIKKNNLKIVGINKKIKLKKNVFDVNNSGIAFRFLSAIFALFNKKIILTGDKNLIKTRDLSPLIKSLSKLNAKIISKNNGFAPIEIEGPIDEKDVEILGEDSQFVSSLLIAKALQKKGSILYVKNPMEKPYVDMTINWLKKFNAKIINENYEKFIIEKKANLQGFVYQVPSDFSTMLFVIVASLITNSEITIENIIFDEDQKDFLVIDILKSFNANIIVDKQNNKIDIKKSILKGIKTVDINDNIDAVPILAVFGCFVDELTITNAKVAKFKESNRLVVITKELKKLNANIEQTNEGLIIKRSTLKKAIVSSHMDHRIALSLIVAALTIDESCEVQDVNCIDKTYKNFKKDLNLLGAKII